MPGQDVVEIMGKTACELPHGLHLLGLAKLLLHCALLTHIARHLGETDQFTRFVHMGSITTIAQNREPSLRTLHPRLRTDPYFWLSPMPARDASPDLLLCRSGKNVGP